MGQQSPAGRAEKAEAPAGAVNSPLAARLTVSRAAPPQFQLGGHHGWYMEVTFEGAKQVLGLEGPANRLPKAVRRTAPMALVLYSLVVLWFDAVGHAGVRFPERPWYRHKREPSFQDMVTTLRRQSWEEKLGE